MKLVNILDQFLASKCICNVRLHFLCLLLYDLSLDDILLAGQKGRSRLHTWISSEKPVVFGELHSRDITIIPKFNVL